MRLGEEEREEMLEEKVEEEEEEREVITVREALVLSISSEYKLTTKYEWAYIVRRASIHQKSTRIKQRK